MSEKGVIIFDRICQRHKNIISQLRQKIRTQDERIKELEDNEKSILLRILYSLDKLGKEATIILIEQALEGSRK